MDSFALLTLVLAATAVMGSPGPSTISATAVGAAFGLRRSLPYVSGLVLGTTSVLCAVALGVVTLLLAIPWGTHLLVGLSAAYILYLAFQIATAPPLTTQDGHAMAPSFAGGLLLAIANPKAYLAIAAVFAGTAALPVLVKLAVLVAMIVLIHAVWLLVGTSLSRVLRDPTAARAINVALAACLVASTVLAFAG